MISICVEAFVGLGQMLWSRHYQNSLDCRQAREVAQRWPWVVPLPCLQPKVTDHHHYWEDGGATYHTRFKTFEFVRGQEGDWWKGDVDALNDASAWGVLPSGPKSEAEAAAVPARWPETQFFDKMRQDNINRQ